MKKIFLLTLLIIGTTFGVQAQDFGFGIKGGLNFSSFSGSDAEELNFEGRTGYHLGLTMEIPLSEEFSVQPEVLYSTLGAKTSDFEFEQATDVNFNVDYISVPVIFKYYLLGGLNVEAGPQFSWNSKSEVEGDFTSEQVRNEIDAITDGTKSFDVGGAVGLGYDLPLGLFAEARYVFGFSKIYESSGFSDIKNNLIQLSVGLKL